MSQENVLVIRMNDTEESSDDEYYNWTSIPEYNAAILVSKYNFVRKREVLTSLLAGSLWTLVVLCGRGSISIDGVLRARPQR